MKSIESFTLLLALTGAACGGVQPGDASEAVDSDTVKTVDQAISLNGTYLKKGDFSAVNRTRDVQCTGPDYMVGAAFDGDTPYILCAISSRNASVLSAPYHISTSKLPATAVGWPNVVQPACSEGTNDAVHGFHQTWTSTASSNTVLCGADHGARLVGGRVEGPGTNFYRSEGWRLPDGRVLQVHVCSVNGYVVRGYNIDPDLFYCAT